MVTVCAGYLKVVGLGWINGGRKDRGFGWEKIRGGGSHHVLPFWLLVASLVRGKAMPLMQCPYYKYTCAHFADLGRMTG